MSDSEDPIEMPDEVEDDLFGDEDDAVASDAERAVSDKDNGDDNGDDNDDDVASVREEERYGDEDVDDRDREQEVKTKVVMGVQMFRHQAPKPKDGTLQSLRVPKFLKFMPEEYRADEFEPAEWDFENAKSSNPKPAIRFRKNPETGELQSNAVMYRWSDGSVSLAVGDEHYEIQSKSLAPPPNKPYSELQDTHYYAAAAHLSSNSLLTVGHIAEQYTVRPNKNVEDDALARLQANLAAAARGSRPADAEMVITITQDPELQKKQAELAEKERMRAQRRRENAAARLADGGGRYSRGGLSIGDLEGGRKSTGGSRKRGQPGAPRQKRRRPEYDSDDDLAPGSHRQEDYDLADDFIAPSDEEEEEGDDDEDEEELLDDDDDDEAPRRKRQKTAEAEGGQDADAELDDADGPAPSHDHGRRGRRHIIDDDEE